MSFDLFDLVFNHLPVAYGALPLDLHQQSPSVLLQPLTVTEKYLRPIRPPVDNLRDNRMDEWTNGKCGNGIDENTTINVFFNEIRLHFGSAPFGTVLQVHFQCIANRDAHRLRVFPRLWLPFCAARNEPLYH